MSKEFWDFLSALPSLIFLIGVIVIVWILARHNYLRKIDYFFSKIIFKTKNILVGEYWRGFDEKYGKDIRVYLALTNDKIIIAPIYFSSLRKTVIPYTKINEFDIVLRQSSSEHIDVDENKFPIQIRDMEFILIHYIMGNGSGDAVTIHIASYANYYKFNKYAYSKCNYFEKVKNQIHDKFIQSFNTYERTF